MVFRTIYFLFIFFITNEAFGDTNERTTTNRVLNNLASQASAVYVSPLLNTRCVQTLNCGTSYALACHQGLGSMATAMQIDVGRTLSSLGTTRDYLRDDRVDVENSSRSRLCLDHLINKTESSTSFNLWTETLQCFRGKKHRALRFLAVVTREVTTSLLPSETVFQRGSKRLMDSLIPLVRNGQIQGYPPGIEVNKSGLYHFYAMGRFASNMRSSGVPLGISLTVPFLANEAYEQSANSSSLEMPYQDIYSGFAGTQFALSGDKDSFTGPRYRDFQQAYHTRGREVAGEYYKEKFGAENVCSKLRLAIPSIAPEPIETPLPAGLRRLNLPETTNIIE